MPTDLINSLLVRRIPLPKEVKKANYSDLEGKQKLNHGFSV